MHSRVVDFVRRNSRDTLGVQQPRSDAEMARPASMDELALRAFTAALSNIAHPFECVAALARAFVWAGLGGGLTCDDLTGLVERLFESQGRELTHLLPTTTPANRTATVDRQRGDTDFNGPETLAGTGGNRK